MRNLDHDECIRSIGMLRARLEYEIDVSGDLALMKRAVSCMESLLTDRLQLMVENAHLRAQLSRHIGKDGQDEEDDE